MTPSFMGRMAVMFPGVRPSISFASLPTASTLAVASLMATMEGSDTTMPLPLAKTKALAVPRSMASSFENRLKTERRYMRFELESVKCEINDSIISGISDDSDEPEWQIVRAVPSLRDANRVLSPYLHTIHCLVGFLHKFLRFFAVIRVEAQAQARGKPRFEPELGQEPVAL